MRYLLRFGRILCTKTQTFVLIILNKLGRSFLNLYHLTHILKCCFRLVNIKTLIYTYQSSCLNEFFFSSKPIPTNSDFFSSIKSWRIYFKCLHKISALSSRYKDLIIEPLFNVVVESNHHQLIITATVALT